jgi:putative intracellular protease/amidase
MSTHLIRRLARLLAVLVAVAAFAGIAAAGLATSTSESFPDPGHDAPVRGEPLGPIPPGRTTVAVVLGATGSVAADVLAPYEVFARSERFFVYTVAADPAPVALSGGLRAVPNRTFADVTSRPDVIVVPAVRDSAGAREAPLRAWIREQAAHGSQILGVCVGAQVLADAGLLDGRRATSHWAALSGLEHDHPTVRWIRGQRYVEDGPVTTTAGVTSGTVGALRLVERLAGPREADRIGTALSYPGWSRGGDTEIAVNRWEPGDLAFVLNFAFPWWQPTLGIGLTDGMSEIDVAAAAETYSGASFAVRVLPVAAKPTITTRHGLVLLGQPVGANPSVDRIIIPTATSTADVDSRLLRWAAEQGLEVELPSRDAPSTFGFDPVLRDLARHTDRATALVTAKRIEYPTAHLALDGPAWPWRPTALVGLSLVLSVVLGLLVSRLLRPNWRHGRSREPDLTVDANSTSTMSHDADDVAATSPGAHASEHDHTHR